MTSRGPVTFPRHAVVVPAHARTARRRDRGCSGVQSPPTVQGRRSVSGLSRSRVVVRTARLDDLPAVLALVRQYRADAHAEGVLTGQTALGAAAAGFRR